MIGIHNEISTLALSLTAPTTKRRLTVILLDAKLSIKLDIEEDDSI